MSCTFGVLYQVTIFGESHSAGIGAVVDGLPAGVPLDMTEVQEAMRRRAPGYSAGSTARRESDQLEILSGYIDGHATGTPLAAIIRNTDTRSQDYTRTSALMRPGHADYTGFIKYRGSADIRGGGHFSGRLTAPLVFAGACARQVLARTGIAVGAHTLRIGSVPDISYSDCSPEELSASEASPLHVLNTGAAEAMTAQIEEAKKHENSIGGVIECAASGVPAGLGEPFFDSVESELAHMMFAIPGIKGIEFGDGFALTRMTGLQANDSPHFGKDGSVTFMSNHSGGINGGITNGMPIVFRVAVRPTASVSSPQETVNVKTKANETLRLHGRHDACIVPRAVEVVRSAAAVVLLDLLMREEAHHCV